MTEACRSYRNKPVNSSFRRGFFVTRFRILFMLWNNLFYKGRSCLLLPLNWKLFFHYFLPLFCFIYMQLLRNFFLQDLPVPCWMPSRKVALKYTWNKLYTHLSSCPIDLCEREVLWPSDYHMVTSRREWIPHQDPRSGWDCHSLWSRLNNHWNISGIHPDRTEKLESDKG